MSPHVESWRLTHGWANLGSNSWTVGRYAVAVADLVELSITAILDDTIRPVREKFPQPTRRTESCSISEETATGATEIRPDQVYRIEGFRGVYEIAFGQRVISAAWLEAIGDLLPAGGSILDVGAGSGRLSSALLEKGFHVVAVEADAELAAATRNRLRTFREGSAFQVIQGSYPFIETHPEAVDAVLFHQNVLLEILNEYPLPAMLSEMARHLPRGTAVIFDYPTRVEPPSVGEYMLLIDRGEVRDGIISYGYSYVGFRDGGYYARLRLTIAYSSGLSVVQEPIMRLVIPDLDELAGYVRRAGFGIESVVGLDSSSFIPGAMSLVIARRS